jgi:hypothetical protein
MLDKNKKHCKYQQKLQYTWIIQENKHIIEVLKLKKIETNIWFENRYCFIRSLHMKINNIRKQKLKN